MLCLNRKLHEAILIEGGIRIVVMEIKRNVVKLGIDAPQGVSVLREELRERDLQGAGAIHGEA